MTTAAPGLEGMSQLWQVIVREEEVEEMTTPAEMKDITMMMMMLVQE